MASDKPALVLLYGIGMTADNSWQEVVPLLLSKHHQVYAPTALGGGALSRLPQAVFEVLPGVGHIPSYDNPHLVARTILATTGATRI